MGGRYIALNCPSCGAQVGDNQKKCPSCGVGLVFEIDTTGASLLQVKRLLELGRYPEAVQQCDNLLAYGMISSEIYYYKCIALLEGKRPFLHSRKQVDDCIEAVDKASKLSDKGIIHLLRAYLEYDYFERKFLNRNPNYKFFMQEAKRCGFSDEERRSLESLIHNSINVGGPYER